MKLEPLLPLIKKYQRAAKSDDYTETDRIGEELEDALCEDHRRLNCEITLKFSTDLSELNSQDCNFLSYLTEDDVIDPLQSASTYINENIEYCYNNSYLDNNGRSIIVKITDSTGKVIYQNKMNGVNW
jgi:hypothetical protein